uniref:Uncharacterized protein n=1 Tax=Solanum lycopersicum TaxID=4081 RepID=A0A3Q7H9B1_SOLLC
MADRDRTRDRDRKRDREDQLLGILAPVLVPLPPTVTATATVLPRVPVLLLTVATVTTAAGVPQLKVLQEKGIKMMVNGIRKGIGTGTDAEKFRILWMG